MGSSTLTALAIFALFLVYVTARGRLPQYLAVLFGSVSSSGGSTGDAGSTAAGAVSGAANQALGVTSLIQTPADVFSPGTDTPLPGGFQIGSFADLLPGNATGGL